VQLLDAAAWAAEGMQQPLLDAEAAYEALPG